MPVMGVPLLRRLTLVLTAVAFVLATALPGSAGAMRMAGTGMTPVGTDMPCSDCPDKAPADHGATKMTCGALACAGVAIGLPARPAPYLPAFGKVAYPLSGPAARLGTAPAPDPLPPRPTLLV
jgi:hypothetical protein